MVPPAGVRVAVTEALSKSVTLKPCSSIGTPAMTVPLVGRVTWDGETMVMGRVAVTSGDTGSAVAGGQGQAAGS